VERLKKLRTTHNLTQEKLAEMLKTTQQTVARWESGKGEPSIAALKDLALIFGTSVDDLLGQNPFASDANSAPTTNHYYALAHSSDGFWGHLGVRAPGASKSTWYPITLREATRLDNAIANASSDSPWIVATTLNNRALVINVATIAQLSMLDDNADEVLDDWELGWDSYEGHSPEIYRALELHLLGLPDDDTSETFKQILVDLTQEEGFDEDEVSACLRTTKVHFSSGATKELTVSDEKSYWAFVGAEANSEELTFDLSDMEAGLTVHIPRLQVAMLDMPLHRLGDAARAERSKLEAEAAEELAAGALAADAVLKTRKTAPKAPSRKKSTR